MNTTYKNKKGFTLIEILLVAAVITILAGVAFYNIHVSIADFKERAEMLSIRNGSYGFFEPGAQFETEQRLNFRNYISEMRSLTGDPSVGVLPENAGEEGVNPAEGGDEGTPVEGEGGGGTPAGDEGGGTPAEEGGDEGTPAEEGGGGDEGGGGGAAYSSRISGWTPSGNHVSFALSDGSGNNINLTITRNGNSYVMSGCDSGMQWILEGHGGAPGMPGYSWHSASYTLNDSQIAWLNNNYGIDVTTIGEGGGGGGSTEATEATAATSAAPAGTSLNVSAGGTTSNGVFNITRVSGTTVGLQAASNSGDTVEVQLSLNPDGTYHMKITGGNRWVLDNYSGSMFNNNGVQLWQNTNEFDLNPTLTAYFTNTLGISIQ